MKILGDIEGTRYIYTKDVFINNESMQKKLNELYTEILNLKNEIKILKPKNKVKTIELGERKL